MCNDGSGSVAIIHESAIKLFWDSYSHSPIQTSLPVRLHGGRYNSARWSFFPFLFYVFSYFLIIWLCWSWHLNEHIPIDSSNCLFINMGRTVTFSKSNSMISFLELLKKYLAKSLGKIKNMVGTWWRNNLHWQFRATLAVKHPLNSVSISLKVLQRHWWTLQATRIDQTNHVW